MWSVDGSSINQHFIPLNTKDEYKYDLKHMLHYDSLNNIYVGFRTDDALTPMKQRIIKFTDTALPVVLWAISSNHNGYILTMTVVESLNHVYAGSFGRDSVNGGIARIIFSLSSITGTSGFAYYNAVDFD
jgi:hypothetical protein